MKSSLLAFVLLLALGSIAATSKKDFAITVFKSPTCQCCGKWEEHLRQAGFTVTSNPTPDMPAEKIKRGIPKELTSCHTGVIGGYVVEGHVPAEDIKRLVAKHPKGVVGLTVPRMPIGSPGMEGPNPEHYQVLTFDSSGKTTVFAEH